MSDTGYAGSFDERRYGPVLAAQGASSKLRRVFADAFGDEYAGEADPLGFVTVSELEWIAESVEAAPGKTLVDLGCGRGGPGLWVARKTGCDLIGLDLVAEGVEEATRRSRSFGLEGRARFLVADVAETGLADGSCDAAMSVDTLWMVLDKAAALREAARILRPGSRFSFTTWEPSYLDYDALLSAAGFRVLSRSTPSGWLERQLAAYRGIDAHEAELVAELGAEAAGVLVAEAREAPALLAEAPRILVGAVKA